MFSAAPGLNETTTHVNAIAPGIYFVTITADGIETQSRIVIQ
ncbi:MAG: T9SS type A sorting domain-containing protein [Bacteroidetes bacterium]|nr:T9SS type A sorting domain-containing protein [Bacteroidota bacterium]